MITDGNMKAATASDLGAKTARACDSCLRRRARWFCAADDAFLCHGCDNLVHSANQLANRHERVRLQTASPKVTWHSGFTRKARTPRQNRHLQVVQQKQQEGSKYKEVVLNNDTSTLLPLVPELGGEEQEPQVFEDESEEQFLCRVPVLDPFNAELCNMYSDGAADEEAAAYDLDKFSEFVPSDMDLAEFAADVESLLGSSGLDEDSGLGIFDWKEEDETNINASTSKSAMVKIKDEELEVCHVYSSVVDWNFNDSPEAAEEKAVGTKREIFLRLNYEEVINDWATRSSSSPWTTPTGHPPIHCSPNCLGSYGDVRSLVRGSGDGEREARVSMYREKRRTRLFAKKIRYQVRKLNAEKRPRMKGRFVKRTFFVGSHKPRRGPTIWG